MEKVIRSFSKLKAGWNYGIGKAIEEDVVDNAITLYGILKNEYVEFEVTPTETGKIILTCAVFEHFLDITITKEETYNITYEVGFGQEYTLQHEAEDMNVYEIINLLDHIVKIVTKD